MTTQRSIRATRDRRGLEDKSLALRMLEHRRRGPRGLGLDDLMPWPCKALAIKSFIATPIITDPFHLCMIALYHCDEAEGHYQRRVFEDNSLILEDRGRGLCLDLDNFML